MYALFKVPASKCPSNYSQFQDMAKAILISGAVIDIIIAGTLSYYLNQARTGIKQWVNHVDQ